MDSAEFRLRDVHIFSLPDLMSLPQFYPFDRRSVLLLCGLGLLHGIIGAVVGLSVDEAHYLLYALHPALSYFDHPPLVGWLQWPGVALELPTVFLRMLPGALWLATAAGVYQLAESFDENSGAGFWALVALALAPLLHVLGIGLLPDSLLMFFTVALMWQTRLLMQAGALQHPWPWVVLGVLLGLAGLSKYTAVLAALAVGVCLLLAHGARVLRNPWAWFAVLLAIVMVSPVFVWNAQNGWISFAYQAQHGAGSIWSWRNVAQFALVQVFAFGPLLWWGLGGFREKVEQGKPRVAVMRVFFYVPWMVMALMAGGGSSLPHWTAPAWVALAPFAGVALARSARQAKLRFQKIGASLLLAAQALMSTALLGLMLSAGQPFLAAGWNDVRVGSNPFADLHGWEQASERAKVLAVQHGLQSLAVQNWTLASRLAWHARPLPVHVLEDRFDQFNLWAGDLPVGADTLLVDWSHMAYSVPLGDHGFKNCVLLETQNVVHWGQPLAAFRFYACHAWSGQAQPRLTLEDKP